MTIKFFDNIDITGCQIISSAAPDSGSSLINRDYLESRISAIVGAAPFRLEGTINASTNPNYPAGEPGYVWVFSASGRIGGASGKIVQAGDSLLCVATSAAGDEATVGANFEVIQGNVLSASEVVEGLVLLASQSEVDAGTNDSKAVTPLKLETKLSDRLAAEGYEETIGDGVETSFTITHNLGKKYPHVSIYEIATETLAGATVTAIDTNSLTVSFNVAPPVDSFFVSVSK
jgi:hypothetical protein